MPLAATTRQWSDLSQADTAQISQTCYTREVYEPSDDTFALVDAMLLALKSWCLEVGSGSGYVTCSLALLLRKAGHHAHCIAVDVCPPATDATRRTLAQHAVKSADVVCADLVGPLGRRLHGCVDLMVFNPPYVLTPDGEVTQSGIAAAWAGGARGRAVIDRLIPQVSDLLSPAGTLLMVTIADNDPADVLAGLASYGLAGREVLHRSADEERLHILQCWRRDHAKQDREGCDKEGALLADSAALRERPQLSRVL